MDETNLEEGVETILDSLLSNRLALLAGAGLSMAAPSNLPSAATLAAEAKRQYDATYGASRDPLPERIEDQAEFFFQRRELATVYFRTLIDQHAFSGRPNAGHSAVADLLLVGGIQTAVTTNVDTLIETAGKHLYGEIGAGIDRNAVAALSPEISPLLKIHGCRSTDIENMVWAPGQLLAEPVASRITGSSQWLNIRLLDRDLLIVGFWTDWDYLNSVLENTLGAVHPARVIVVDPSENETFQEKAPELYSLGRRATTSFQHVRASGDEFLNTLRRKFSLSFIRRVFHSGADAYLQVTGTHANPSWMEHPDQDCTILWKIRRDLEGSLPDQPATKLDPPQGETLVGLTLLQLQAAGAVADGEYWLLGDRRIRVVRTLPSLLHQIKMAYERENAPVTAPDVVIAVGAEGPNLGTSIARPESQPSIIRGGSSHWMTRTDAIQELDL